MRMEPIWFNIYIYMYHMTHFWLLNQNRTSRCSGRNHVQSNIGSPGLTAVAILLFLVPCWCRAGTKLKNSSLLKSGDLRLVGGNSNIYYFHSLPGEMIQLDSYFSKWLKPPTRCSFPKTGLLNPSFLFSWDWSNKNDGLTILNEIHQYC